MAKGLLPYHGLGSRIKRAIEAWSDIEFKNDYEGCLFTVVVHRKNIEKPPKISNSSSKTEDTIMSILKENPYISATNIGDTILISKRGL